MRVYQVKGGWHAAGYGWAVRGATEEEAIQKFHEAVEKHKEIDQRGLHSENQQEE